MNNFKWIIFPGIPTLILALIFLSTDDSKVREVNEKSFLERMIE